METTLRQIEILTKTWDTISNMYIRDSRLREEQNILLDKLTEKIIEKTSLYLKSGKKNE